MSVRMTLAVTARVLAQLRRDPRTLALVLGVPCLLETLLKELFAGRSEVFQHVGAPLLGLFPFATMFLVAGLFTFINSLPTGWATEGSYLGPRSDVQLAALQKLQRDCGLPVAELAPRLMTPVSTFFISIGAPATTAPAGSATVPVMVPRSLWANNVNVKTHTQAATNTERIGHLQERRE